jgi:hypothetical protein
MSPDPVAGPDDAPARVPGEMPGEASGDALGWRARMLRELRTRPFGYTVLALFLVAGPVVSTILFPQAPIAVTIVGGLVFGLYAALCAVPQKFI